jgi:hypothetical protein
MREIVYGIISEFDDGV